MCRAIPFTHTPCGTHCACSGPRGAFPVTTHTHTAVHALVLAPTRPQVRLYSAAAKLAPADAELQVALGVLHHLARQVGRMALCASVHA